MNQVLEKILLVGTAIGLLGGGALFISSLCFTDTVCALFGTLDMLYAIAAVFAAVGIVCAIILGSNALARSIRKAILNESEAYLPSLDYF